MEGELPHPLWGDKSLPSTSLLSAKTVRSTVKHGKGEEKTVVQRELEQVKESIHVFTSFFSKKLNLHSLYLKLETVKRDAAFFFLTRCPQDIYL